ncbi:hypothetical protein ES319_D07G182600v1 [Gossypium barbadense]|uniref:Endonuclease/exonuclease/phosphatase domain-containing protein n=1 Tax=Gossypium barbadense TaxID=3634 RepID=A0A5J5QSB0_GOSBA|nr:hypothetical protein ES319_D07G182600v1 [Gossypium barbadense]
MESLEKIRGYGDYNELLYSFEKVGVVPRKERRMKAFRKALDDCQLGDMGYSRNCFTCEQGNLPKTNIRELLDKGVTNNDWLSMFPHAKIKHLPNSFSDHYPILLSTVSEKKRNKATNFKFEAWWTMESL